MNANHEQLHNQILYQAKVHRKSEARLIDLLQKADSKRLYLHRGHSSLFRYVCDELGYSEAMTSNLITVARKAREIPALKEEIRQGNLSVSKLRKVCPVIDQKNQEQWIAAVKTSNTRELEQMVAAVRIDHTPRESLRAVAKNTSRLSIDICEESREKLERLKDLLSSKEGRDCSLQEVLDFALETTIDRHDPIRKAERASKRKEKKDRSGNRVQEQQSEVKKATAVCHVTRKRSKRKSLAKRLIHKISMRDKGRCTFVSEDGKWCTQTRWLHIHHKKEVSLGGEDSLDNLTTLCSAHHKLIHRE